VPEWLAKLPGAEWLAIGFHLIAVSLVSSMFFREQHLGRIVGYLQRSPFDATREEWVAATVLMSVVVAGCVPLLLGWIYDQTVKERVDGTPWEWPLQTTGWAAMGVAMFLFYRVTAQDFVYFQF